MFRKFVEFLDVREATDEEVAEYEARFNPQQKSPPPAQQISTIQPAVVGGEEEEDRLSEVSLGSNSANGNNNNEDEFHAVSLSSPPNIDNPQVFSFESNNNVESSSFVAAREESPVFLQTIATPPPLQEDYYPERGDVITPPLPPPPQQTIAPPLYHPQPILPTPSSPSRPRRPSLESALAATPFRGTNNNKSVSFSSPFKPLPAAAASLPVPNFSTSPVLPPPPPVVAAKTPSPTIEVETPVVVVAANPIAPHVFPKTPFPKSGQTLPSTVKLPHNPPLFTSSVLRLDDSLADMFASENAHLNSDLDQALLDWARNTPSITINNNTAAPHPPQWNANSPPQQQNKDRLHAEQLAAKSQRIAALEQSLLDAERARVEKDRQIEQERSEHASTIAQLNQRLDELSTKLALQDTQDLVLDFLKSPSSQASNQDDLLKHCGKLVRQLEAVEPAVAENLEALHLSGKLVASLSAKVTLLEQQVQDEKLVLKNLFLSWMERAERQDAFEILASAFGFTQEDRERLNSKPSWKRAHSLGVAWPFSESVADFVRDETS